MITPGVAIAVALAGAAAMIAWRYQETSAPVTLRKIVIPPIGMSTGLCMFLAPAARVPWAWAAAAFALGALVLFFPLARSSRLIRDGEAVMMRRSKAFLWILLGLVAVRLALRSWAELWLSPIQTGAIFFLIALGAVIRWRVAMLRSYLRLVRSPALAGIVPAH